MCDKILDGFGEQMRAVSLKVVPTAILSRQIAGIRGRSLIVNLPGKPSAIRDCLLADVVMRPRFELTGWKHFDQADAYAEAGYKAGAEVLPALRKLLPWLTHDGD